MWSILALAAAERLINGVIDLDGITRVRLDRLQGQCLRVLIDAPLIGIDVYLDAGKVRLEPTPTGQPERPSLFEQRPFDRQPAQTMRPVTATLHVATAVELMQLLTRHDDDLATIPLQGDYHLLFELRGILAGLSPDLAASLSPWIGPVAAQQFGRLDQVPKQLRKTARSAEFILTDALIEDSHLFAGRWQADDLWQQTRDLQQSIDRAEARLQLLEHSIKTVQ